MTDEVIEKQVEPTVIVIREEPAVVTVEEKHTWTIPFNNVIPAERYPFLLLENDGYVPIKLEELSISSSIAGVVDAAIFIYYVDGEDIDIKNPSKVKPLNSVLGSIKTAAVKCTVSQRISGLNILSQIERFDIGQKFTTYKVKQDTTIPPGASVALVWGTDMGSLSGSLVISE